MMEIMPILEVVLFIGTILGSFVLLFVFSHQKLEIEKGKRVLHTQTNGGVIGWIQFKGPFISVRIYEEFIVIGCGKKYVLHYEDIDRVEIKKWLGLVSHRIQLIHHNSAAPGKILLGTSNPTAIKELIEARLRRK